MHLLDSPHFRPLVPTALRIGLVWITIIFIAIYSMVTGAHAQLVLNTGATTASAVVQTEQLRAELVAHAPQGVESGKPLWIGLLLTHQPHWHTYWKNPGDSGLPTTLQWTLPAGLSAGDIDWPTPQRIAVGSLANYGYEGAVLLPVPVAVSPDWAAGRLTGDLEIKLFASWLVCRETCIPQEGNFVLRIPALGSTAVHGSAFDAAHAASPQAFGGTLDASVSGDSMLLTAKGLPAAWHNQALQGFPETTNVLEAPATPQSTDTVSTQARAPATGVQVWDQGVWSARVPLSTHRDASPESLPMVLAWGGQSLRAIAPVQGTWPAVAARATVSPALQAALDGNPNTGLGADGAAASGSLFGNSGWQAWLLALAAAVLGGLILNLMPCVLPVLAIKVLALTRHSEYSRASQRAQGAAYALGVIVSFVALGGLLLGLRATGEQLGWGFHLQSPGVLAGLAALFTLLALNLAGVFEVGRVLPSRLAGLQARHPVVDSFLTGVLAVAVASPCTAPFMGASLGYAIGLPAVLALGVFAALGLGLALPFLVISWIPALQHWLPRPGAWMQTLRQFMAFPMLATVVWLVWVLGHLTGVDGAASLLLLLLALALLVWSLGLTGRSRWLFATISIATVALFTGAIGRNVVQITPTTLSATDAADSSGGREAVWQAWAPGRVDTELAAGRAVFVDFTAAWCITCQYNKKTTLSHPDVVADMQSHRVVLLRADWTRRDPAISQALEQLGRSGVPVYALYQPGHAPVVFSEILSVQTLRAALASL